MSPIFVGSWMGQNLVSLPGQQPPVLAHVPPGLRNKPILHGWHQLQRNSAQEKLLPEQFTGSGNVYRLATLRKPFADLSKVVYFSDEEAYIVNSLMDQLDNNSLSYLSKNV